MSLMGTLAKNLLFSPWPEEKKDITLLSLEEKVSKRCSQMIKGARKEVFILIENSIPKFFNDVITDALVQLPLEVRETLYVRKSDNDQDETQEIRGRLERGRGRYFSPVVKRDFSKVIQDTDGLFNDLIKNGYLDGNGKVQDKFKDLRGHLNIKLGAAYESKRREVYDIVQNQFNFEYKEVPTKTIENGSLRNDYFIIVDKKEVFVGKPAFDEAMFLSDASIFVNLMYRDLKPLIEN